MFLAALAGIYHESTVTGVAVSPASVKSILIRSREMANTFLESARSNLWEYVAVNGLTTSADGMIAQLERATTENVSQMEKMARVGIADHKRAMIGAHGAVGLLLQKKLGKIEFKLYDTSNRRWDAESLVLTTVRDFAYQAWLDQRVVNLADSGYTLAHRWRETKRDNEDDVVFSTRGRIDGYPTFDEVRASAFHVNSTARIDGYVQS
jgi:hypothetical protein